MCIDGVFQGRYYYNERCNMNIDDADMSRLDDYTITPVVCNTALVNGDGDNWQMALDIRFRVSQGTAVAGRVYAFMIIGLEYDEATGHFIRGNALELEYQDIEPASWG